MLTYFQAFVLAVVQGATEFIPISSSGHLVLVRVLFGWTDDGGLVFDTVLHGGSLAAVFIYFRREWAGMIMGVLRPSHADSFGRRMPWLLVAATVPIVLVGPLLKPLLECADGMRNASVAGLSMIATALWFWLCDRRLSAGARLDKMGFADALLIGCAQIVALLPGASRSGWTTGAGVLRGYRREDAVRFAFYMVVPAIMGAMVLQFRDIFNTAPETLPAGLMLTGFAVSLVVSLLSIRFCLWFFREHSFRVFRFYLLAAGIVVFLFA